MKRTILTTAAFVAVLFLVSGVNAADKYFRPAGASDNWSTDGVGTSVWYDAETGGNQVTRPVDGDTAHILAGKTCYVDVTDGRADAFAVEDTGTLIISAGKLLEIDSNSSMDGNAGVILAGDDSYLKISDNLTISGGGSIDGRNNGAEIQIATGKTLINTAEIEGNCQIVPVGGASTTFTNNGIVHANNVGTLGIAPDSIGVSSGIWQVSSSSSAILQIGAASAGTHGGSINMSNGTLDVNYSFSTTGNLSFTGGTIDVVNGATLSVNQ